MTDDEPNVGMRAGCTDSVTSFSIWIDGSGAAFTRHVHLTLKHQDAAVEGRANSRLVCIAGRAAA